MSGGASAERRELENILRDWGMRQDKIDQLSLPTLRKINQQHQQLSAQSGRRGSATAIKVSGKPSSSRPRSASAAATVLVIPASTDFDEANIKVVLRYLEQRGVPDWRLVIHPDTAYRAWARDLSKDENKTWKEYMQNKKSIKKKDEDYLNDAAFSRDAEAKKFAELMGRKVDTDPSARSPAVQQGQSPVPSTTFSEVMKKGEKAAETGDPEAVQEASSRLMEKAEKDRITEGTLMNAQQKLQANFEQASSAKNEMKSNMTGLQFLRDTAPVATPMINLMMDAAANFEDAPTGGVYTGKIYIPRSGLTVHRQRAALNGMTAMVQSQHDHWNKFSRYKSRY